MTAQSSASARAYRPTTPRAKARSVAGARSGTPGSLQARQRPARQAASEAVPEAVTQTKINYCNHYVFSCFGGRGVLQIPLILKHFGQFPGRAPDPYHDFAVVHLAYKVFQLSDWLVVRLMQIEVVVVHDALAHRRVPGAAGARLPK